MFVNSIVTHNVTHIYSHGWAIFYKYCSHLHTDSIENKITPLVTDQKGAKAINKPERQTEHIPDGCNCMSVNCSEVCR